jgi:hypothetical protein
MQRTIENFACQFINTGVITRAKSRTIFFDFGERLNFWIAMRNLYKSR